MALYDEVAKLQLLNITEADKDVADAILSIRNEPDVRRNMYTSHQIQPSEHEAWLQSLVESAKSKFYAVLREGAVIGGVGISAIDRAHSRADWAYYLSTKTRGRGIGSALEFKFLDHVFKIEGINKLNCEVIEWNAAVVKLHKKFGFVEEGRRRAHVIRDGEVHDVVLLGITNAEWRDTRAKLREGLFSGT